MENEETQTTHTHEANATKPGSKSPMMIVGTLVLILGVAAVIYFSSMKSNPTKNDSDNTDKVVPTTSSKEEPKTNPSEEAKSDDGEKMEAKKDAYKDGKYTATGDYTSPAGAEQVEITLTLDDNKVTEAAFNGKAKNPVSVKMQTSFSEGFKEKIVGKSVDEISLGVVNGSSLAPKGFMDALDKIKDQAKS